MSAESPEFEAMTDAWLLPPGAVMKYLVAVLCVAGFLVAHGGGPSAAETVSGFAADRVVSPSGEQLSPSGSAGQGGPFSGGQVVVAGKELLRDGRPWIPHAFYQIAFEVAPADLARADHKFWTTAYQHYTPKEYQGMHEAGADSVRLQISQAAADPTSPKFDKAFLDKALDAVRAARQAGLTVIVSIQDESHVPGDKPIDLPDNGTRRVWQEIAPQFANDQGVLYELLNEPRLKPNPLDWQQWAQAMNATIQTVRLAGARNVVIADGLDIGQVIDGAPMLADSQVAYASHPYALNGSDQTRGAWDAKFGTFVQHAPVIITEWGSGAYYCDTNTPESTVKFINYLQEHRVGLVIGTWDWAPGGFGSYRWDFPNGKLSKFSGLACRQNGYGSGEVVRTWYKTGVPANSPE